MPDSLIIIVLTLAAGAFIIYSILFVMEVNNYSVSSFAKKLYVLILVFVLIIEGGGWTWFTMASIQDYPIMRTQTCVVENTWLHNGAYVQTISPDGIDRVNITKAMGVIYPEGTTIDVIYTSPWIMGILFTSPHEKVRFEANISSR